VFRGRPGTMGQTKSLRTYATPTRRLIDPLPRGLARRKPRAYAEWRALRTWKKLPLWELEPAGFLLRLSRERADLTQEELASRLGTSQQAVAQAERWNSNPTIDFMRQWARACDAVLRLSVDRRKRI
jgi:DNA-binding XRE family transcriptional regulator